MNKIILSGGKYYIKLAYNPEWIKQIKTFKAMWNPQGKVWELPARGLDYTDFIKFLKNAGIVVTRKEGNKVYYHLKTRCILRFMNCIESVLENSVKARASVIGRKLKLNH